MRLSRKGKFITLTLVLGIPLLALAGIWRLGLLPLFFNSAPGGFDFLYDPGGPDPGVAPGTPSQTATPSPGEANGSDTKQPGTGENPAATAPGKNSDSNKPPLQRDIEARHIAKLQDIARSYAGKLNSLTEAARSEYVSAKQEGKSISAVALARRYMASGSSLEADCDAQFYDALAEFEAELRQNSLPLDTAQQARQEYEWAKASRKKEILANAAQVIIP
jgi:hypothetical protein